MASKSTDPCSDYESAPAPWNSENWCYQSVGWSGFFDLTDDDSNRNTCYTNCSQICTDPKLLLSFSGTIVGCLDWDTFHRSEQIDASSHEEVNRTYLAAIGLLNSCMQAYCSTGDLSLGGCPYNNISVPDDQNTSAMVSFEQNSGACNVVRTVNSDLGGPGVFVSYILQMVLAWLIILFILPLWIPSILKLWRQKLSIKNSASSRSEKLQQNSPLILAASEDGELPRKLSQDHPPSERKGLLKETNTRLTVITDVVTEFQESQCYFILATHTAAFVAIARGDLFAATSFRQASANCDFILVMAEISTVMNYLGITMCFIVGMSSRWIRTLTILSLIFSLVAMGLTSERKDGRCFSNSRIKSIPPLSACGDHPPPNAYCGLLSSADINTRPDVFNESFDFWSAFGLFCFCIIFIVFLIILFHEKLKYMAATHQRLKAHIRIYRALADFPKLLHLLLYVLCAVTGCLAYILSTLFSSDYVDFKDWGIGQIIAVFIWVPVVAHWIRWLRNGGTDCFLKCQKIRDESQ